MKKILTFSVILVFFFCKTTNAQDSPKVYGSNFFRTNLPNGIYKTKADFIAKTPTDTFQVNPKSIGLNPKVLDTAKQNCYFYLVKTDKKITDAFAISYKGNLFFQIGAILKNRNKTDRAQMNNFPNSYVAVLSGGDNYLYTEANLVNAWAYGAMAGSGIPGSIIAQGMVYGKGIVWDFKNGEFNIFKSCDDYNEFIKDKFPDGVQDCKSHEPDMIRVREALKKIL